MMIPTVPLGPILNKDTAFTKYIKNWFHEYSFLEAIKWKTFEPRYTGFNHQTKKFEITFSDYLDIETHEHFTNILHELIHVALVRKDELFLPNIGMLSEFKDINEINIQYWTNELSIAIYTVNIYEKYPSSLLDVGNINFLMPYKWNEFFDLAKNNNFLVPSEWHDVDLNNIIEKMGERFTVEDFEAKLHDNLKWIGNKINGM